MSHAKEKLWTKDFIVMSLINFFILLIFYLLMVTIASFAVKDYHATTSQAGLVTGIYIIGTLIGRLGTGRVIDHFDRKHVLIVGLVLFIATLCLYFIHAGITVLLLSRFVNGFAVGIASTATGTIVAQVLPISRKGEGIGYYSMSTTLGTAIGPFIGILMSQHTSYNMIFALCVLLGVISLIIGMTTKVPPMELIPEAQAESKGFSISQYIEPKAIPIAIITVCMSLGYAGILSFINFFAKDRDLVQASSFFFVVYAIAILITRPFSGRLMDTKGANFVMYPCFVLFGLGLLLLSTAHSNFVLLAAGAIIGIGYGNLSSSAQAIAVKVTPSHRMGLATSTFFIAMDGGLGIGPYLLGFIIPLIGYGKLYVSLGIFIFITLALYFLLHGRKDHLLMENKPV